MEYGTGDTHNQLESNDAVVSRLAQQDKIPWYSKPNLRLLYLLMCPTCIAVKMTNGFDASMINGLQSVTSWLEYYNHPHSTQLGLMASMYSLGCVGAVPFAPSIVDRIGRRYSILLGGTISIFGGILQGSALNFTMFVMARFILGFANVFCVVAASSLVGELSHPKERAVMSSVFSTSYDLGSVIAAAITLGTFAMTSNWGWRIPSFLQTVPSLLQVSFIWFLPESPRWLVSKGRRHEAYNVLVKYHAEGDPNSTFAKAEYAQIEEALEAELKVSRLNRKEAFSNPGMRKRFIITIFLGLCIEWCGGGLVSYFLPLMLDAIGIHDNRTKNTINLARVGWSLVNSTVIAFTVPHYPRRRIFLTSTISIFIVFTAWTVATAEYSFNNDKIWARMVLALIFLFSPAYNLGFTVLIYTYLVELFPFHARVRGIAIYHGWSRCAAFLNQLVNPIGVELAGWRWYIIYCVWDAFQIVFVYFMFPETSGRTLEELTFLFEEDREAFKRSNEAEVLLHGNEGHEAYGALGERAGDEQE